jgi:hypothetical protein
MSDYLLDTRYLDRWPVISRTPTRIVFREDGQHGTYHLDPRKVDADGWIFHRVLRLGFYVSQAAKDAKDAKDAALDEASSASFWNNAELIAMRLAELKAEYRPMYAPRIAELQARLSELAGVPTHAPPHG